MKQQSGLVSMMSALVVSVLMIVASMGLIVYINSSTQQGSDDELSLRAYAAAQGGVEWAYNQLLSGATPSSTCTGQPANVYSLGATNASTSFQNFITCLSVTSTTATPSGTFDANNDSTQIAIYPTQAAHYVRVKWLVGGSTGDYLHGAAIPSAAASYNTNKLPDGNTNPPPAIELTIVNYAGTAAAVNTGSTINIRNVVLLPDASGGVTNWQSGKSKATVACPSSASYQCDTGDPVTSPLKICPNVGTTLGDCTTDSAGNTPPTTSGPSGVTIVYARALYLNDTNSRVSYQLQFIDNAGNPIQVADANTTIDVTARAGSIYRRVVAKVPRANGSVPAGLNYVLFSDTDICKSLVVPNPATGQVPTSTNGCDALP